MHTIVVPIDFSSYTEKILHYAQVYAKSFQSSIYLIHVTSVDPSPFDYENGPQYIRDHVAKDLKDEHQQLHFVNEQLSQSGIKSTPLYIKGDVAAKIIEHAKKLNANLIIMGSHGHSAFHKALMGSVSEAVLRNTSCPILFIPSIEQTD